MALVIAGGPSVTDYPRLHLENLARCAFTFAVNEVAFDFPCDVVVSIDPWLLKRRAEDFKALGKPIITRPWDGFDKLGLDLIYLKDDCFKTCYYSGMVAAKLADGLAKEGGGRKSYVIGIDASFGRYQGHKGDDHKWHYNKADLKAYDALNLTETINLSVHSKVSSWPKRSKLPRIDQVIVHQPYRIAALAWLRKYAAEKITEGVA